MTSEQIKRLAALTADEALRIYYKIDPPSERRSEIYSALVCQVLRGEIISLGDDVASALATQIIKAVFTFHGEITPLDEQRAAIKAAAGGVWLGWGGSLLEQRNRDIAAIAKCREYGGFKRGPDFTCARCGRDLH